MKYICTSYIWWGLYKTFLIAVHVLELMEPRKNYKRAFYRFVIAREKFQYNSIFDKSYILEDSPEYEI